MTEEEKAARARVWAESFKPYEEFCLPSERPTGIEWLALNEEGRLRVLEVCGLPGQYMIRRYADA